MQGTGSLAEPALGQRGRRCIVRPLKGRQGLFTHCRAPAGQRTGSLLDFPGLRGVPGHCMAPVPLCGAPGPECPPPLPGVRLHVVSGHRLTPPRSCVEHFHCGPCWTLKIYCSRYRQKVTHIPTSLRDA